MRAESTERVTTKQRFDSRKRLGVVLAALAVAVLAACAAPPTAAPPPAAAPSAASACTGPAGPPDAVSVAVLNATNASRAGASLGPLAWNPQLWCLASEWSNHSLATNAIAHRDLNATLNSPEYAGYRTVGENLYKGPVGASGDAIHAAWMASPLHQANILSPAFNSIGFAFATGNGQMFATENFGG